MNRRLTQAEYARHCGVNRSTVNRWIKSGRIQADPRGLIDPEAADRQRDATESPMPHHQARKAQIEAEKAQQGATAPVAGGDDDEHAPEPGSASEIGLELKRETLKLQRAKAERESIELDKLAGSLVERADVDYILDDFGNTLRALLEGLPDRLAAAVAAHRGDVPAIHKTLEEAARDILTEIAGHMQRKMGEATE